MATDHITIFNVKPDRYTKKSFEYPDDIDKCDDARAHQGFTIKQKICPPFFNSAEDVQGFFEIIIYRNPEGGSICEFWDYAGEVYKFYCETYQHEFELTCKFMELAKNMCQSELALQRLNKNSEQDHDC